MPERIHKALIQFIAASGNFITRGQETLNPNFLNSPGNLHHYAEEEYKHMQELVLEQKAVQNIYRLDEDIASKLKGLHTKYEDFRKNPENFLNQKAVSAGGIPELEAPLSLQGIEEVKKLGNQAVQILKEIGSEKRALKRVWKYVGKLRRE